MEESGHFNRLASELDVEERANLLEKLSSQSSLGSAVLYEDTPNKEGDFVAEDQYQKLPWYYKIYFFILSFFNSRPPVKLFEDHVMTQQYREMEEKYPGYYNFQKDVLLSRFQEEMINLRDASRFFYNALDASIGRDKGGLMIFLGSLEMPKIHKAIISDSDPITLSSHYRDLNEIELRQKALKSFEDALSVITEAERNKMYNNSRALFCLKQLASFLFDRLINSFIYDSSLQDNVCPAASVRDQLLALNNILYSLKTPPPIALLESLFIYVLMEKGAGPNLDIHGEMKKLLVQAETSLQSIRDFNTDVPLTRLLRCISRNPGLNPQNIGGGEDWYQVYRERWKHQVEENYLNFTRTRRQKDIQNAFRYFFKGTSLKMLDNMGSEQNPSGITVKGNFCLSFLHTFYSVVFMGEINRYLRPILIEGDFVKKENRTEFTEYYNNLIKLEDLINRYDRDISPQGEIGKTYIQAKNDMTSLPVKRRKIQIVVEEAAHTAERIIEQTKDAMAGMVKVLGGIMRKSSDDKYDTLANLNVLAGRGTSFQDGIKESITSLNKTLQLLEDIDAMEAGR
ncbi:MAG: DUF5312 domain-containing protein [Treponema sp.]|nr:DUF5312 domain-containing protein [Treponema sp.]